MTQLKSIYRYLGIALVVVICFTAISTYFFLRSDNEVGPNLITAFVGVVLSALITLLLLNGQTKAEEEKQKSVKVFEEQLAIYKEFLKKLCIVVRDQHIDPREKIMLQFQVANLSTHTSESGIKDISGRVEEIVQRIKQNTKDSNELIEPLLDIADVFHRELYHENRSIDPRLRKQIIESFKSILISEVFSGQESQEEKNKRIEDFRDHKTVQERLQYLSGRLDVSSNRQWIYNGYVLVHEFNNDINPNTGNLVKGDNRIIVDLSIDGKQILITLFTRQYDENESRRLVNDIWQGKVAYNPNSDKTRHVCADLPVETSDDEIVALMTQLLNDVKQYQVKKYKPEPSQ